MAGKRGNRVFLMTALHQHGIDKRLTRVAI
jgi:hypothetical protein